MAASHLPFVLSVDLPFDALPLGHRQSLLAVFSLIAREHQSARISTALPHFPLHFDQAHYISYGLCRKDRLRVRCSVVGLLRRCQSSEGDLGLIHRSGGSRGIGLAIARRLASEGANVTIAAKT